MSLPTGVDRSQPCHDVVLTLEGVDLGASAAEEKVEFHKAEAERLKALVNSVNLEEVVERGRCGGGGWGWMHPAYCQTTGNKRMLSCTKIYPST